MEVDDKPKGEGFRQYYITKIEELQLIVAEKSQNLRRLQAQRNELNAKGNFRFFFVAIVVCWIECIYSFGYNFIIW
jgi:hypothetical protein